MNEPLKTIKKLVKESNQATVARVLGISEATLSRILKGNRRISEAVAQRLGYRATWEVFLGPEGADRPILMKIEKGDDHV